MFKVKWFLKGSLKFSLKCSMLFFAVLTACAAAPKNKAEPQWVSDPYTVYNRNAFIAAVGYGPSRDAAEKSALTALTSVFGQSVNSETSSTYSYSDAISASSAGWSEKSDIAQAVKTSTAMDTLIGVEIKDVWDSGTGTIYAVAAMDRAKTNLIYSEMIQQNVSMIGRLTSLSSQDKQSLDGFIRYQQAANLADANAVFANVIRQINPGALVGENLKSGTSYRLEASEIAKNIPITVSVTGDKQGRIKSAFSQALTTAGFRTGGNDSRYVLNASVSLEEAVFPNNPQKYVRYLVDSRLTDTSTGTVLFPYSVTDRVGHSILSEAENRALREAEASIRNSYVKGLGAYLSQGK
jgi:hypothetical protein